MFYFSFGGSGSYILALIKGFLSKFQKHSFFTKQNQISKSLQQQKMLNSNQKEQISRYDLKKQLQGIQSFDISSFGESKNESSINIRGLIHGSGNQSLFPSIEAPTLELLQDSEYNIRYLDQQGVKARGKKVEQKRGGQYYEDLTARNSQSATTYQYEEKIEEMRREVERMAQKLQRERKEKQLLHEKINLLEIHHKKTVQELKEKNKEQKEQIKVLKEREIKASRQRQFLQKEMSQLSTKPYASRESRAGSISSHGNSIHSSTVLMTSYMDDPSCFCPELLSPEETVVLLSRLLKKVSKSSKMIKELTEDQSVRAILQKIEKR